ncbi:hypothetical protein F4861DRAFT_166803 [Xylaria intraflava]|nr:hypothetical protein F4861DRAFT_166803 [Xylaria intraflava]
MAPKMKRKGAESSLDLPSLFPTHDGSYGINTLINIDAEAKKGHKPNDGIAEEQSDDRKWVKSMKSRVAKKYGMNSNLRKAIIESHEQVEKEHRDQIPISPNAAHISNENAPIHSEPSEPTESSEPSESSKSSAPPPKSGKASEFLHGFNTEPVLYVPKYNPNNPPFSEEYHDQPQPPHTQVEIPSYTPYAPIGQNQTAARSSEYVPFYGMPNGKGSMEPISPMRPDTPRSFNDESRLFADAILQTPSQNIDILDIPLTSPQGLSPPLQSQQKNRFGSTGVSGADRQHMAQSAPSMQPNTQRQATTGQAATGQFATERPTTAQPTTGQPHPMPTLTSRQPTTHNFSNAPQPLEPSRISGGPKVPKAKKILEVGTPKQGLKSRAQQSSNKPPSGIANTSKRNPLLNRSDEDTQHGWISPSSDFIVTSLVMFSALVLALWATLSAIPSDFSDINITPPRASFGLSNFSIGTMWEKMSNLLPEAPNWGNIRHDSLYNIPGAPGFSDRSNVDYEKLITDLKNLVPDTVWVQKDQNGKVKISEDFWHALKEMNKVDSILDPGNSSISDDLWNDIKSRIRTEILQVGTEGGMPDFVDKKISQSWESWLRQNNQSLGKASTGAILTKDEFMKLFQQEAASHEREIRKELKEVQGQIKAQTKRLSKLQDEYRANHSMSADEINDAIDATISKLITNAKLDAITKGHIRGLANDVLADQWNIIGNGAGGTIDSNFTSKPRTIPKEPIGSNNYLDRSSRTALPPAIALSPWTEEGECFCAGPDRNGYGQGTNNISVLTSRNFIPQHLVVEHILPGATIDPGAMPREIEVWAYIEAINLRNELKAFSAMQFPDTPREQVLNDGFVKIGHFTYEKRQSGDGVQVFKISDELARMRAITNHIVIRAINNYGADHTCFYYLRMYGEVVERSDDTPPHT